MANVIAGIRIREHRRTHGITQASLAEQIGISPSYLNLIERNKRGIATDLLRRAADALDVRVDELDGTSERRLVDQLSEVAADPRVASLKPEHLHIGEFIGRYPGWARALSALARAERDSGSLAQALADRLNHDPFLGEAVHKMLTHITAVRSIAEIIQSVDDIESEQRGRFHAILTDESLKLTEVAEALAAYFDKAHTDARSVTPLDEVEALFEDNGNRFDDIDQAGEYAIPRILDDAAQVQTATARKRAREALEVYAEDGRKAGPRFPEVARQTNYDLDLLIHQTRLPVDVICRRLTALPEGHPKIGYIRTNAAGALLELRPLTGFHPPRSAAFCPLWVLARAAQHPERAVRQFAGFPNGQRLVFVARSRPSGPVKYGAPLNLVTDMLVIAEEMAGATAYAPEAGLRPEPVGTACRICPRDACEHRVEDPISG